MIASCGTLAAQPAEGQRRHRKRERGRPKIKEGRPVALVGIVGGVQHRAASLLDGLFKLVASGRRPRLSAQHQGVGAKPVRREPGCGQDGRQRTSPRLRKGRHLRQCQVDENDPAAQNMQAGISVQQPHRHAGHKRPNQQRQQPISVVQSVTPMALRRAHPRRPTRNWRQRDRSWRCNRLLPAARRPSWPPVRS